MNLFQVFALTGLGLLIFVELLRLLRGIAPALGPLFRLVIWLCAAGFILFPDALTYIARWLGIGVGANLLLYLLTLAFLAVSFLLYARTVQLRRQMTLLVRHLALTHPLPPSGSPPFQGGVRGGDISVEFPPHLTPRDAKAHP